MNNIKIYMDAILQNRYVVIDSKVSQSHFCAGKCVSRFTNKKVPYCVRFNPDEDKQNLFVVGCSDKKIYTVS